MSGNDPRSRCSERRAETLRALVLVLLCGLLFFSILDARPLWNIDEGMHSATSKEMVQTGDWITPHHNDEPFYDKPALHNWFVAISFMVFGFTEAAARLPSAILGLLTVLVTWWIGRRMYGSWAGFFGAAILASSGTVIVLSQSIVHDSSLLFFVTAALALFYRGYSDPDGRGAKWFLLSYLAFGMAILAKGPIGLLLPGGVVFFFLVFRRDLSFLGKMGLHWGVPLGLLVSVPWFAAIATVNGDYLYDFFVRTHLGSFVKVGEMRQNHPEPWFFYITTFFGLFAPWSLFLPGAVWRGWQRRSEDERGATILLFVWIGLYLLFFSAAESKLTTYLLPIYPAAALLVGRLWAEVATRDAPAALAWRGLTWPTLLVALLPIAGIVFLNHPKTTPDRLREEYGLDVATAAIPCIALFACLVTGTILLWRGRIRLAFTGFVASISTGLLLTVLLVVPALNPIRSSRDVSFEMDRRVPPGETLVHFHRLQDSALFYTDRPVFELKYKRRLKKFLSTERRVYVLISDKRYKRLELDEPILMRDGKDLLISNREDP